MEGRGSRGRWEEETLRRRPSSDTLDGTLAQSDRVTFALLRKLDDALRDELRSRISAINKPQLAQGFLEDAW
jgi:hypothetical protein